MTEAVELTLAGAAEVVTGASIVRTLVPPPVRERLRPLVTRLREARPRRPTTFGELRRVEPLVREFGMSRGDPVDRYYIERFLEQRAEAIRGRVLEIGTDAYTRRFGGGRVTRGDVLHVTTGNPKATIVADLTVPGALEREAFDCILCTQTLSFIYDVRAAVATLHDALAPGGTLLVTVPGLAQISRTDMNLWGDYWRFTTLSLQRLLEERFGAASVAVAAHGNVLTGVALLHGVTLDELEPHELDHQDPDYQLIVTGEATR